MSVGHVKNVKRAKHANGTPKPAASDAVPPPRVRAFVALGSNLGAREERLRAAKHALDVSDGVRVVAASRVYETDPVGPPGQGPYLNAVLELETSLVPEALLARLLAIEAEAGRRRDGPHWGPRTLDLDLLLYGALHIDVPGLSVPHPRLHERPFVLEPLCELAGDLRHPTRGTRLCELATSVRDPRAVRVQPLRL